MVAAQNNGMDDSLESNVAPSDDDDLEAQMAAAMAMDKDAGDDDLEAQMAAAMAKDGGTEEDDLEAQMAAAMSMGDDAGDDLEAQMAAAMNDDDGGLSRGGLLDALSDDEDLGSSSVQPLQFPQLRPSENHVAREDIDRLLDVTLMISVELGRKQMLIKDILELGPGKIVELEKLAGEPVDLLVNGKILARGEVVVVDENFGVRITDLVEPKDRIKML